MDPVPPPDPHAIFNPADYLNVGFLTEQQARALFPTFSFVAAQYYAKSGGPIVGDVSITGTLDTTGIITGSDTTEATLGNAAIRTPGGILAQKRVLTHSSFVAANPMSAAVPAFGFTDGFGVTLGKGMYEEAGTALGFSRNGIRQLYVDQTGIIATPPVTISSTAASTSTVTGSLMCAGGLGVAGAVFTSTAQVVGAGTITPGTLASGALRVTTGGVSVLESIQTTTGQIYTGNGALATPGFAFASNPNCGVHRLAANSVGFVCNGATALATTTAGAYVVGRLGVGLSTVPGANQVYVQTFSAALVTPLVLANSTSGGPVRQLLQSTAADSYTIWDTGTYGSHVGIRQSDGFMCVGTTSASPTAGPNQITISPAGVVNVSTSLTVAGVSVFGYSQPMGLNQTNVGNAWLSAPCPASASVTIHATQPYGGGPVQLEISTSTWTASATAATITIPVALDANFRPTVGPLVRPFCYFIPGFAWSYGLISITTTGFVTLTSATGNWVSGTQYRFANSTAWQIAAL